MIGSRPGWVTRLDELHLLTLLRVVAIVVVALIITVVVRALIGRALRRTIGLPGLGPAERVAVRQKALSSVLRSAVVGVVWAVAVITIIGEVGLNVGGLVATATVVGGAVAFGAQTLIRDVISGFFVLAEDQYGVGDAVDVGHATGTVERITLRSVRLRDGEGRVWHVPHGGVARVANLSKSPLALLDLEVARSTALDGLAAAAASLCAALTQHPQAGPVLAGEPSAVGITDVRDDRLVYRVAAPTQPGHHDEVRRAWRELALAAFERGELAAPEAPATVVRVQQPGASATE